MIRQFSRQEVGCDDRVGGGVGALAKAGGQGLGAVEVWVGTVGLVVWVRGGFGRRDRSRFVDGCGDRVEDAIALHSLQCQSLRSDALRVFKSGGRYLGTMFIVLSTYCRAGRGAGLVLCHPE
ncbi:hypothetical protein Nepgr_003014 [Nepenthes gracilis]|uniref:Uncharacterized protein n=1 Tax=Nepenthes gracilis TaxID=150966 RepID=A0AAD3RYR3_NEPGR|nr:hypothetical protein Nepgr_003014 [Nepenthes gracilis]